MIDYRCQSGRHCVKRTSDGAAATHKPETLCHGCVEDIQGKLGDLPALIEALKLFIGYRPVSVGASKVKASREPAPPMNLHAFDLVNEIADVYARAGGGVIPVRDLINQAPQTFTLWFKDSRREVALTGVKRALDVRRVWLKADDIIGLQKTWQRRHAPCPDCGNYTLGGWVGSGRVECTYDECGLSMPFSDYEAHCIVKAKEK